MRKGVWVLGIVLLLLCAPLMRDASIDPARDQGDTTLVVEQQETMVPDDPRTAPLQVSGIRPCFIENLGQLDDAEVTYYAPGSSVSVGFGPGWVSYAVRDAEGQGITVFRSHFVGCNPVEPTARNLEGHPTSYFIGTEESDWVVGARSYRRVLYQDLYEGVDLVFYFQDGCLKYDVVVGPGGDATAYRLSYEGVASLELEGGSGDLLIRTHDRTLREDAPWAYQMVDGNTINVAVGFVLEDDGTLGFGVGAHDPTLPLVIDPGLAFSTYLGGSKWDYLNDMAVDDDGHMYLTGYTESSNFPTKAGSYDTSYGAYKDAFAVKLARDGSSLEFATFLGGGGDDRGEGIYVDDAGCAHIVGGTGGSGYPTTVGAYDRTLDGSEAFVTKLKADGTGLVYSTYLGGTKNERGYGICLDDTGNVSIHGETTSNTDFPVTSGCYDRYYNGGDTDAFFARLNASADKLLYATYLGGSGREYAKEVGLDGSGDVYLMGHSLSTDFPTTAGAFDRYHGGNTDIYVTKLNTTTSTLTYSTFVGWMGVENGVDLFIDAEGCAYVPGLTESRGFPTTSGAYQRTLGGWYDAFCFKLNAAGSDLVFSTFLGKSDWDQANGVWVASNGTIYLAGNTGSSDFPTTTGAYCTTYDDYTDAFLTILDKDASRVLYSTFIGGDQWDRAQRVVATENGSVYLAGHTISSNFPTTPGAYDTTHDSQRDLFALMLDLAPPETDEGTVDPFATTGDPFHLSLNFTDNWGVDRVEIEYWHQTIPDPFGQHDWVNMTMVSGTSTNGTWNATFNAWNNSVETLNIYVHAWDLAGNKMPLTAMAKLTFDNDAPLVEDLTVDQATTGDNHSIRVNVTDNIGFGEVRVVYWFGDRVAEAVNATMTAEDLTGLGNGTYVHNLTVPMDPTISVRYRLFANDSAGNWNLTDVRHVDILDNDGPRITVLGVPKSVTAGEVLVLNASVLDNIGVEGVWLEYWYGDDPSAATNVSLSPMDTDAWGNGTYSCTIEVDPPGLGSLHLVFKAIDLGSNVNTTVVYDVMVIDGELPFFGEDLTPGEATTGDPLVFSIEVLDNMEVQEVWVHYWYGRGFQTNGTMREGPSGKWRHGIAVDHTEDALYYVVFARDTYGNRNSTPQREVTVVDNDPPEFIDDRTPGTATTGDPLTFEMEVRDNLVMTSASVIYWFEEGEPTTVDMEGDLQGGTGVWTFTLGIGIPSGSTTPMSYRFEVADPTGNRNSTVEQKVEVVDDDPPVFGEDLTSSELIINLDHTFRIEVFDNIGVVAVHHCMGQGQGANETLMTRDGDEWWVVVNYTDRGQGSGGGERPYPFRFSYFFKAVDAAGNIMATEVRYIVETNVPPAVEGVTVWELVEEDPSALDLAGYITDPNHGPEALSIEVDDPDVWVTGLILRVVLDTWVPDRVLEVAVSDGIDTTFINITMTVENVNDEPVIGTVLPENGSVYIEGMVISFSAEATDEDGDDLTYTWREGADVIGEGPEVDLDGLSAGEHTITLEVSDGAATSTLPITVVIEGGDVAIPSLSIWLLLVLVVVVVAVVVAYVVWNSRRAE